MRRDLQQPRRCDSVRWESGSAGRDDGVELMRAFRIDGDEDLEGYGLTEGTCVQHQPPLVSGATVSGCVRLCSR